ncbi:hypothetical protein [Streptomyces sp. NPDC127112]|uniref:hypothetical protein n=1 Tax=Streptomyces sp. NPDC127112 TaxID=3345364 RepID=UPI00363D1C80
MIGSDGGSPDAAAVHGTDAEGMAVHRMIVYPPDDENTRMVHYDGVILGRAFKADDIREFLRAASMQDPEDLDLTGPLFEWREIGPESWEESSP